MDESTRLFSESNTRSDAALILGQLVATSVTTFIQVPSDKVITIHYLFSYSFSHLFLNSIYLVFLFSGIISNNEHTISLQAFFRRASVTGLNKFYCYYTDTM